MLVHELTSLALEAWQLLDDQVQHGRPAQGDQVVFHEARGLSSIEYGTANHLGTRFNLGSINKLFTRVAIGQLAENGRLALDDTIEKFLSGYANREAAQKVSIRQLLDMTSGIGDFFGNKFEETPKDRIRGLACYASWNIRPCLPMLARRRPHAGSPVRWPSSSSLRWLPLASLLRNSVHAASPI